MSDDYNRGVQAGCLPGRADTTVRNFAVGRSWCLLPYAVTREAIIKFATEFDPQPYHLNDAAAASNSVFGRLSASGWHTAAIANLMVTTSLADSEAEGVAGLGVDNLRWLKSVHAGDVLQGSLLMVSNRPSISKPGCCIVALRAELVNQDDQRVFTMTVSGIFKARGAL